MVAIRIKQPPAFVKLRPFSKVHEATPIVYHAWQIAGRKHSQMFASTACYRFLHVCAG